MSKDFSRKFYSSKQWQKCRNAYIKRQPLCEECLKKGVVTPVEIVHHIIELTPYNINNPSIALGFDNLQSVCRECHLAIHGVNKDKKTERRYAIADNGDIVLIN